ncbi:hypothetical protein DFJ73DRAFT_761027 [Zopfochytrium polystomum]|nr:hypothetical protein DFJ73DRAFT_761027 [Zopfochytrium polystomum]
MHLFKRCFIVIAPAIMIIVLLTDADRIRKLVARAARQGAPAPFLSSDVARQTVHGPAGSQSDVPRLRIQNGKVTTLSVANQYHPLPTCASLAAPAPLDLSPHVHAHARPAHLCDCVERVPERQQLRESLRGQERPDGAAAAAAAAVDDEQGVGGDDARVGVCAGGVRRRRRRERRPREAGDVDGDERGAGDPAGAAAAFQDLDVAVEAGGLAERDADAAAAVAVGLRVVRRRRGAGGRAGVRAEVLGGPGVDPICEGRGGDDAAGEELGARVAEGERQLRGVSAAGREAADDGEDEQEGGDDGHGEARFGDFEGARSACKGVDFGSRGEARASEEGQGDGGEDGGGEGGRVFGEGGEERGWVDVFRGAGAADEGHGDEETQVEGGVGHGDGEQRGEEAVLVWESDDVGAGEAGRDGGRGRDADESGGGRHAGEAVEALDGAVDADVARLRRGAGAVVAAEGCARGGVCGDEGDAGRVLGVGGKRPGHFLRLRISRG